MYRNWTSLIKPQRVEFVEGADPQRKATIVVEPLERGFGTTLGNALRRVLSSSLPGAAISSVRIGGAVDAISAIPGIVENATDILLNLKGVVVRMEFGGTQIVSLVSEREGLATAGDIMAVPGIEILNPDHPIATVSRGGRLDVLRRASLASSLSLKCSGVMSLMTPDKSRNLPSASIKPGFSRPTAP